MKRSMLLATCAFAGAAFLGATSPSWSAEDTLKAATVTANPSQIEIDKLVGQKVKNAAGDTIGDIDSILLDKDGKAIAAIVGVGGFLGMGEREVALGWNALKITDNGRNVQVDFTKEQLKSMPEYKFSNPSQKDTAFYDQNYRSSQASGVDGTTMAAGRSATGSLSTMGASSDIRTSELAGTDVVNAAGDKIGDIDEVIVAQNGRVRVVLSVGGFLGMGEHHVAVDWSSLAISRDSGKIHARLNLTKAQLQAMPEYKLDSASR